MNKVTKLIVLRSYQFEYWSWRVEGSVGSCDWFCLDAPPLSHTVTQQYRHQLGQPGEGRRGGRRRKRGRGEGGGGGEVWRKGGEGEQWRGGREEGGREDGRKGGGGGSKEGGVERMRGGGEEKGVKCCQGWLQLIATG